MHKIKSFLIDCKKLITFSIKEALKVESIKDVKDLPAKMMITWVYLRFDDKKIME